MRYARVWAKKVSRRAYERVGTSANVVYGVYPKVSSQMDENMPKNTKNTPKSLKSSL